MLNEKAFAKGRKAASALVDAAMAEREDGWRRRGRDEEDRVRTRITFKDDINRYAGGGL